MALTRLMPGPSALGASEPLTRPSEKYLRGLRRYGVRPSLERIRRALDLLGRPQLAYPTILVTGTNGKGSAASCAARILRAHGLRVGLFLSPHLFHYEERIRVNGAPMAARKFDRALADMRARLGRLKVPARRSGERSYRLEGVDLTEFEMLTALAAVEFARRRVDWAVFEVGMGGRWDATNTTDPRVSILTDVAIDHTDFLGHTLVKIAREKMGVARPGRPLLAGTLAEPVRTRVLRGRHTPWFLDESDFRLVSPRAFQFERRRYEPRLPASIFGQNLALSIRAARLAVGARFRAAIAQRAVRSFKMEGRFERRRVRGRQVILDVAHNESALRALMLEIGEIRLGRLAVVIGMKKNKSGENGLLAFLRPGDEIFPALLTESGTRRSMDWRAFQSRSESVRPAAPLSKVLRQLFSAPDFKTILICGSFATVREASHALDLR